MKSRDGLTKSIPSRAAHGGAASDLRLANEAALLARVAEDARGQDLYDGIQEAIQGRPGEHLEEDVAHPNRAGHEIVGDPISAALRSDLYADGDLGSPSAARRLFRRADANADGAVDVSDPIATLGVLFLGNGDFPCDSAADANADGAVDVSDPIATLGYLFLGNVVFAAPGATECGLDGAAGKSSCKSYEGCGE